MVIAVTALLIAVPFASTLPVISANLLSNPAKPVDKMFSTSTLLNGLIASTKTFTASIFSPSTLSNIVIVVFSVPSALLVSVA